MCCCAGVCEGTRAARDMAFFCRVALLTSSGTGSYSQGLPDFSQFLHGSPPQHLIFLLVSVILKVVIGMEWVRVRGGGRETGWDAKMGRVA